MIEEAYRPQLLGGRPPPLPVEQRVQPHVCESCEAQHEGHEATATEGTRGAKEFRSSKVKKHWQDSTIAASGVTGQRWSEALRDAQYTITVQVMCYAASQRCEPVDWPHFSCSPASTIFLAMKHNTARQQEDGRNTERVSASVRGTLTRAGHARACSPKTVALAARWFDATRAAQLDDARCLRLILCDGACLLCALVVVQAPL